jgi:leader peptidase (prepilin peptidase)/N-methyltransferase
MPAFGLAAFALAGLLFGSLAAALSYRLPRGLPVLFDRSRCPACQTPLSPRDLVPLLSWIVGRGRCRHCQAAISIRYPLIELATTGLFLLSAWQCRDDLTAAVLLAATAFGLVVIAVADLESGIIPDQMVLFLCLPALAGRLMDGGEWLDGLAGAAVAGGASWAVRAVFRRWRGRDGLGLGDVKFLAVAGLFLGLGGVGPYLLLSSLLGVGLGLAWRIAGRGQVFPFGPALAAGLLVSLVWPEVLGALGGL